MKRRGRGETIVSGSQGKMIIVFEQFGSGLPATKVKKETCCLYGSSCLIKGSMSVLLERHILLALNFNVKVLTW